MDNPEREIVPGFFWGSASRFGINILDSVFWPVESGRNFNYRWLSCRPSRRPIFRPCFLSASTYNAGTPEQHDAINWVIANQKRTLRCDSYALIQYPAGDPLFDEGRWWYSYWHNKWGFSHEEDPKGIVVVTLSVGSTP